MWRLFFAKEWAVISSGYYDINLSKRRVQEVAAVFFHLEEIEQGQRAVEVTNEIIQQISQ